MLAAEYETLPDPIRDAVISFLDENELWLEHVLERGRETGALRFEGPASEPAQSHLSGLEGAMLVARPYGELGRFELAAARTLAGLTGAVHER